MLDSGLDYANRNVHNVVIMYLHFIFYNFNINILICYIVFLGRYIGACAPLYLRPPEDGFIVPKHVVVIKTYVQFVIVVCAFVRIYN